MNLSIMAAVLNRDGNCNHLTLDSAERAGTVQYYPHGKMKQEELHRPPYEEPIRLIKQKEWFHVRVQVSGRQVRVFLDRKKKPALVVDELLHQHRAGSVGLRSWGGAFANLVVTTKPQGTGRTARTGN